MPQLEIVEAFVAHVESGDYVGALERYYAPEAWQQENNDAPRVGRDLLIKGERMVMAAYKSIAACRLGEPLISKNQSAVQWRFEFTPHEGGEARVLVEVALQTWLGDQIVGETFFYDPKQMGR